MSAPGDRFAVSVPGSSANLGPGFDAIGVALSLRMRATVEPAARLTISFDEASEAPSHEGLALLMLRTMREVDARLPGVHVRVANDIPLGKGLGSSAAAVVLALAVALRAHGKRSNHRDIARLACRIEGHPDNALAAVFGAGVIAADATRYVRFSCSPRIRPLLVVPEIDLDTHSARMLLPASYDRADVVFTAQRAALLGAALASGDLRCLREAMRDRVHQPYRAARIPGLQEALAVRDSRLAGIALSGAGPSVIALVDSAADYVRVAARLSAAFARNGVRARVVAPDFCERGLQIRSLCSQGAHAA